MSKIDVLDDGYVRLVDHMGGDLSVVRAARVSHDADWRAGADEGKDEALIHYLMRNKHSTPFESVELQFEVQAPIFVFRQWHRHRTWSFNEVSGRYTEMPELFYVPDPGAVGVQSKDNKQARDLVENAGAGGISATILTASYQAFRAYRSLLEQGAPREVARMVLPLNSYSRMFAKVDLMNLLKFVDLRDHPHAQHEMQLYARALLALARGVAPISVAAWEEAYGR